MSLVPTPAQRLESALDEVLTNRQHFSEESFYQVVLALNEKIKRLEALPEHVARYAEGDEIRLVTVMFIDVENSTRLAQSLEEEWKTLLDELHRRIARVVAEWDGEIGQYLGDGVLCFFGARHSRGDDPARAVSCALAIQHMVADYAPLLRERYAAELALRVGISTGRVVVGLIGSGDREEFVAMGPATNLAARLQTICPPRYVVIDTPTCNRVRGRFLTQAQPPVALKGFDTPVEGHLVLGRLRVRATDLADREIAGVRVPFVDRATEFKALLRLMHDAARRRAFNVVTLYGEAGVGKSRLLQETLARASDEQFLVLTLAGRDEKTRAPYGLLHDLVADLCNIAEGTAPAIVQELLVQSVRDSWPDADPEMTAAVVARLADFDIPLASASALDPLPTFAGWLRAMAGDKALLLLFDNLQWADGLSLDLMEHLARTPGGTGGMLIATARPHFRALRPRWMAGIVRAREMTIGPLPAVGTREMVDAVLSHVEGVPAALPEHICHRSEGNPLYVEEFLRMLFDNGVFEEIGPGRWRTNLFRYATLRSELPSGLMGVSQARLDDLPYLARRLVQAAAVLGLTFWESAVIYLVGFDARRLLDDLVARGLFARNPDSTLENQQELRFRHALHRDVAYAMLTRADREAYHARAAEWLAGYVFDRADYLGQLAEHLYLGQKHEQAMAIYSETADHLVRRRLPQEALRAVESGLACASDVAREIALPLASQLWMWQAEALILLGRYDEASAAAGTALMLMGELPAHNLVDERQHATRLLNDARRHLRTAV